MRTDSPLYRFLARAPRILATLSVIVAASASQAQTTAPSPAALQEHAERTALHQHPEWLALGHYRPARLGGQPLSQADDERFFLSPQGRTSPQAELHAALRTLTTASANDDDARCRFPARDRWLREQLQLAPVDVRDCPALREWLETLNTERVTLVFAASYLNSPSSMFGHTLLRLDPPQASEQADLLLANTISYAADAAEHDSELLFAYRGIFGGYPGITTVQPYYEKIRLYSDIENRDLWEYQLNLTPAETERLLLHAWEIRDKRFDYYFFDENCAYRLLALIDVARPGTRLLDRVSTHAIPSDTVRWVMDSGLVEQIHYRPSAATTVAHYLGHLDDTDQQHALALADGQLESTSPEIAELPAPRRARLYDATYEYLRYAADANQWPRDIAAPRSYRLLHARSRTGVQDTLPPPAPPDVRDDQGHDTFRLSLMGGAEDHREYLSLGLRPAYHDLLDPPEGYRPGAQLQFLRLDTRYYRDGAEWQLERLVGVEIRSLSARDAFFSPLSWQVGFGGRRSALENGKRILTPYLDGGAGFSWPLGSSLLTAMGTADLEWDSDHEHGYAAAPGVDIGLLQQNRRFSLQGGVRSKLWQLSHARREDQLYLNGAWHLGRDYSVSMELARREHYERYTGLWQIGLHAFF